MPNTDQLILDLLVNSRLAQYPDKKLYNAATMLLPDERPVVPVEMGPDSLYFKPGLQGQYVPQHERLNPGGPRIYIPKTAQTYKDDKRPRRLAAVLAHEGHHSRGFDEADSYQFQHDVLKRMGETDEKFLRSLLERSQTERAKEAAKR